MTEDSREVALKINFLDVDDRDRRLIAELIKNQDEIGVTLRLGSYIGFRVMKEKSIGPMTYHSLIEEFDGAPSRYELRDALKEAGANPDLSAIDWGFVNRPLLTSSKQELEEQIEEKDSRISKLQEQKESLEDELNSTKKEKQDLKDVCQEQKEKIEELEQQLEEPSETDDRVEDLFEEAGLNEPEL